MQRLSLLIVLCLALTSCASWKRAEPAYLPPKIDCEIFAAPAVAVPSEPGINERHVQAWQLYAWHWQAYAEHVLNQRLQTAVCVYKLRKQGIVR